MRALRFILGCACLIVLAGTAFGASITSPTLLVPNANRDGSNSILLYDVRTGAYEGVFAAASDDFGDDNGKGVLQNPNDIALGPDGKVYVTFCESWNSGGKGGVARFLQDGTYDGLIVDFDAANPGDEVLDTTAVTFGQDGMMYVGHVFGVKRYSVDGVFDADIFSPQGGLVRDVHAAGAGVYFQTDYSGTAKEGSLGLYNTGTGTLLTNQQTTSGHMHGIGSAPSGDPYVGWEIYIIGGPDDTDGDQDIARWEMPISGTYTQDWASFPEQTNGSALGVTYYEGNLYIHDGNNGDIRIHDAVTGAPVGDGFLVENDSRFVGAGWGMIVLVPEPATLVLLGLASVSLTTRRRRHR